jgi:hypothetical protein
MKQRRAQLLFFHPTMTTKASLLRLIPTQLELRFPRAYYDRECVNLGVVRQAYVEARILTLPVVDGTGTRFTRRSTADGLSQTNVSQIVQDDQSFMWFGSQYGSITTMATIQSGTTRAGPDRVRG